MTATFIAVALTLLSTACAQPTKEMLFNGEDLTGWKFVVSDEAVSPSDVFAVNNGVIQISGTPIGYMYTEKQYGNYALHVEWRYPVEASNSGIFLIIVDPTNPFPNGIECQLAADRAGDFVCLGGSDLSEYVQPADQPRPRFPVVSKRNPSNEKPIGEWNTADIEVRDGHITVTINGLLQNVGTNAATVGHIGLQSEGKQIEFRNVYLVEK
jgi:hypothetical protein